MYRLIFQKPAHFLSAQMALLSTCFQMFICSTWDVTLLKVSHSYIYIIRNFLIELIFEKKTYSQQTLVLQTPPLRSRYNRCSHSDFWSLCFEITRNFQSRTTSNFKSCKENFNYCCSSNCTCCPRNERCGKLNNSIGFKKRVLFVLCKKFPPCFVKTEEPNVCWDARFLNPYFEFQSAACWKKMIPINIWPVSFCQFQNKEGYFLRPSYNI